MVILQFQMFNLNIYIMNNIVHQISTSFANRDALKVLQFPWCFKSRIIFQTIMGKLKSNWH
jgi:hypothetical protein